MVQKTSVMLSSGLDLVRDRSVGGGGEQKAAKTKPPRRIYSMRLAVKALVRKPLSALCA